MYNEVDCPNDNTETIMLSRWFPNRKLFLVVQLIAPIFVLPATQLKLRSNSKGQELTPEQKQTELERHRALLLATLDYLEQRLGGSFVCDDYDPVREYYQQQKIQTEQYFKQRRLDRLRQRLSSHFKGLQNRVDLNFTSYLKEKTGYEIDIFDDLRKRVDAIVSQNEIRSQSELNDIGTMLHFYQESAASGKEVEELKSLVTDYSQKTNEMSGKNRGEYSDVISRVDKDGFEEVTVSISTGAKTKYYEEQWATSPDGKHKLRVAQWSDSKQASTYIAIHFANGSSGAFYGLNGICPDVKAWWKDKSAIVVETKKEYTANTQHKQVRSFDDIITIEYVEH